MNTEVLLRQLAESTDQEARRNAFYQLASPMRKDLLAYARESGFEESLKKHQQAGLTSNDLVSVAMGNFASRRLGAGPLDLQQDPSWEATLRGYLKGQIKRTALDALERGKVREAVGRDFDADEEGNVSGAERQRPTSGFTEVQRVLDDERYIREGLAGLRLIDNEVRLALIGHYVEGLSYRAIATALLPESSSDFEIDKKADTLRKACAAERLPATLREEMEKFRPRLKGELRE